jgi:hypothetical protein
MIYALLKLPFLASFIVGPCNPNQVDQHAFFGFPHWWKYIKTGHYDGLGNCTPEVVFPGGIWSIAFAVTDMLLYLAGIVAVISIIIAGVSHITSDGNPEKAAAARKRIWNSLIGLGIVLAATGFVAFIGNRLG